VTGRPPSLSVVVPVYNEAGILRGAAEELCRQLEARGWDYELILTENGSTDGTKEILTELAARLPRLRALLGDEPNYGKALCRAILESRNEVVICDEIDLCDLDFYARALPLLEQGVQLVVGSKSMRGADDKRPLLRRAATRAVNLLLRLATGFRGTDTHGLKAFWREPLLPVVRACVVDRDLFASELVIRAGRMGRRVQEIPITLREKRPPSVKLLRRVPRVLRGLLKLFWVIRIAHR
jgi:glycosyltransferase involved in cell wall biosynthesis